MFGLAAEGIFTTWPASAERAKGYRAENVIGRHLAMVFNAEDIATGTSAAHLAEAEVTGPGEWEMWQGCGDGTRFRANKITTAVRDADNSFLGFSVSSRNCTARHAKPT